jgi:transposase
MPKFGFFDTCRDDPQDLVVWDGAGYETFVRANSYEEGAAINAQITIPLDIPDVRVVEVEQNERGEWTITVESTMEGTRCRLCGRELKERHGVEEAITLRHLPILGRPVDLRLRPKRYRCSDCDGGPTTTQQLSWSSAKSPHTKAYEKYILLQLVHATIEDVSIKEGLGTKAIEGRVERWISREVQWGEVKRVKILGLDEIALKKGHRDFVVIVTGKAASGEVKILAVLPDRKKQTVKQFLERMPRRVKHAIRTVCPDMYEGFILAVKEVLGKAHVVIDRYHVAKLYRAGADRLRTQEMRRLKQELPKDDSAKLKGAMWPFRKKATELEPEEQDVLTRLFTYSPTLQQAYELREQLTSIFDAPLSKDAALQQLTDWQQRVSASGLTCYDHFLRTLEKWQEEITNYFLARHNSGFVEGLNNKIKVLKRRCYGIFNLSHLCQRLSLDLEGYQRFAHTTG